MRDLPAGTVTFLFTDIEGSTQLLHELGDDYAPALAEHRRVLRDAFAAHRGVEVDTQGDAFFVAFARARDAIAAAGAGQAALAGGSIRVRMGVHTGEPLVTDEGYVGIDVHRAARIAAAGHGGQVLVSSTTRELVEDELLELGEHRLKDFAEPVALFQLGEGAFPPLKTISNTNLPRPASSFVGRAQEVDEVVAALRNGTRLLTLTGPGGSGKTRLAIEAAGELLGEFKAGVFWVGLASIRDPSLVAGTIARTIGARGGLADHVGERELLLLLDNLEQVVEAAPDLALLIESCPNLRLLVTSRELLRVRGEVEHAVEPLDEPDAVKLFCDRAGTEADRAVEELCRALDNLPLALELAAARTGVLSPRQINERLSERLDLFTGGRDADPRHRTLRATIEWSHDLLAAEEQRLFARLAIFARGCTFHAAESVAGARLDTLQSLVEKGLVRHTDERFWMLETIREFAAERLRDSGEEAETARRHAEYFRAVAIDAKAQLEGLEPGETIEGVEEDLHNIRSACRWSVDQDDFEGALSIAVSLWRFWSSRGCPTDFLALLEEGAEQAAISVDEGLRAEALWVAGFQAVRAAELTRAARLLEQSLELFRKLGMEFESVRCLCELSAIEQTRGRKTEAAGLAEEARAMAHELGEPRALAAATSCAAELDYWSENFARAADLYEEALGFNRQAGQHPGPIASSLYNLGLCAQALGEYERAEAALREALEIAIRSGHAVLIESSAVSLANVTLARGDLARSRSLLRQAIAVVPGLGNPEWTASALNLSAAISSAGDDHARAARLWGAADALREQTESLEDVVDRGVRARFEPGARSALGSSDFEAAYLDGRRLQVEHALQLAIETAGAQAQKDEPQPSL